MNNDLISRSALYRKIKTECNPYGKPTIDFESGNRVLDIIDNFPTATADNYAMGYQDGVRKVLSERPKGTWVKDEEHSITIEMFKCTNCGFWNGADHFKFCPGCGAQMVGDA